jgi:hypothetical protein
MGDKINNFVKSFDTKLSDLVKKQVESDNEYKRLRDIAIKNTNIKLGKWPDTDPNVKTLGNLIGYVFPESRFSKFNEPPALTSNTPNPLYMDFITDLKSDKTIYDLYNQLKKLRGIKNYVEYEKRGGGQFWFDTFMYVFNNIVSKDDNFIRKSVDEIKKNTGSYAISRFDNKIKEGLWMSNYGKKTSDYGDYIVFYSYLIDENDLNNYRPIELSLINLAVERDGLPDDENEIIKVENKDKRNSDLLYQAFLEAGDSYSGPNTKKIEDLNSESVKEQLSEANKIDDKKATLEEVPKNTISGTPSVVSGTTSVVGQQTNNNTNSKPVSQNGYLEIKGKLSTIYIPDIPKNYSTVISAIIFYPSDLVNNGKKDKPIEYKDYETYRLSDSVKTDFLLNSDNPLKTKGATGSTCSYVLYKDKTIYGKFGKEEWGEVVLDSNNKGWLKKSFVTQKTEYNSMYETLNAVVPDWFKKYIISIPLSETIDYDLLKSEVIKETENKYVKHKDLNLLTVSTSINTVDNKLSEFKNIMLIDPFVIDWKKIETKIDEVLKLKSSEVYLIYNLKPTGTQSGTQSVITSNKSTKTKKKSTITKEGSYGDDYNTFIKVYNLLLNNKISDYESKISAYNKTRLDAIKISDLYVDSNGKKIEYPKNCNTVGEAFSKIFSENGDYLNGLFPSLEIEINIRNLILDKYKVGDVSMYDILDKNKSSISYIKNLNHIKNKGGATYWIDLFYKSFSEFISELKTSDDDIKKIDYFNKLRIDPSFEYFLDKLKKDYDEYVQSTLSNSFVSDSKTDYIKSSVLHGAFLSIYFNKNSLSLSNSPTGLSASTAVSNTNLPNDNKNKESNNEIETIHQNLILNKNYAVISKSEDSLVMLSEFFASFSKQIETSLTTFLPSSDTDDNKNKESVLDGSIKCKMNIVGIDEKPNTEGYHLVINSGEELPEIKIELLALFNAEDEYKLSSLKDSGLSDEYLEDDYNPENTNKNEPDYNLYTKEDLEAYVDSSTVDISLDQPSGPTELDAGATVITSNNTGNLPIGNAPAYGSKLIVGKGKSLSMINLGGHRLSNIPADLQKYLRANGFPGAVIASNGIMRGLYASAYPDSPVRVAASYHGCGLAHDLIFQIPGIVWKGIGHNKNLAVNTNLNLVIWNWVKQQGDLTWGGEWGKSDPGSGNIKGWGITEYHHFQIKESIQPKYWEPVKDELAKYGFKTTDLQRNGRNTNLHKLMRKLMGETNI